MESIPYLDLNVITSYFLRLIKGKVCTQFWAEVPHRSVTISQILAFAFGKTSWQKSDSCSRVTATGKGALMGIWASLNVCEIILVQGLEYWENIKKIYYI